MRITSKAANDAAVLVIEGRLDAKTAPDAQTHFIQTIDGGERKVVIDLARVDYVSSAGLRVLLIAAKRLKAAGGELRICNLNDLVAEVFELSGFSTIFAVFGSESEALDGF